MACPQCEWEIFQTGRYEPTRQGRKSSSKLPARVSRGSGGRDCYLAPGIGGEHIAARILRRRRSEHHEGLKNHLTNNMHTILTIEKVTGELASHHEVYEKSRQSLCHICSLDLRSRLLTFSFPFPSYLLTFFIPLFLKEIFARNTSESFPPSTFSEWLDSLSTFHHILFLF
jgi:hypothetical protein